MKFTLVIVCTLLAISQTTQLYSQKKDKKNIKQTRDTIAVSDIGALFRAALPPGFNKPKADSTLFATEYGNVMMRAAIAENQKSAYMIGFYDFFPDYFVGKTTAQALDSLQSQVLGNMQGKLSRQYKLMLAGKKLRRAENAERPVPDVLLESRTTYFTTVTDKKKAYWRFALILDSPRIYQIAVTSSNKSYLDSPTVNKFFDSAQIVIAE
ncbi:hypothetical protein MASR2M18_16700 [Ignavibacteria bacterium]|nr:hypothetical protein [Bacteroidota bacterium]MCZ2133527.1 hypothetical protein [Bacteroidota bacterium]